MDLLKRKIDGFLAKWKENPDRKPLIVKGARQVGKTVSIRAFGHANYESVIEINFVLQKKFRSIFDNGYEVDTIIKNISLMEPSWRFMPYKTLIFFDELQKCPDCATSLKSFNADPRYDVICSGSLMGIYYEEIESNAVGNKEDYEMHSLDFEEFLWARGYSESQVEDLYKHMASLTPFSELELNVYMDVFRDYMTIGGMPEVVKMYIDNGHFGGTLELLRQLLLDYEEDITKYAKESDKAKILAVYRHISTFLAKTSKKFQITKVAKGARNREYIGAVEWLEKAGVVNICYCLGNPELPLKGNYDADTYKVYYHDTGLLIASLDEEAQEDLRANKNFGTYKGAIYENVAAEELAAHGYTLYYYNGKKLGELDFVIEENGEILPIEIKSGKDYYRHNAIDNVLNHAEFEIDRGYVFCNGNVETADRLTYFPIYMLMFIQKKELPDEILFHTDFSDLSDK